MRERNRRIWTSLAVCAALAGLPAAAQAWAAGTHAYIAKHTNKANGTVTDAELYRRVLGANGPDLFNATFADEPQLLALVLHGTDPTPNLAPWEIATGDLQRAFAYGFASHNNAWGSDATAHFAGRTYGHDVGYVIAKEQVVGALLAPTIGAGLGLPPDLALALSIDVSHNFVEYAVDFLLAQVDPDLGATLYVSSLYYFGQADDDLLVDALVPFMDPALAGLPQPPSKNAEQWIRDTEAEFVASLGLNGQVLAAPLAVGKPLIAQQLAQKAIEYLGWRYPGLIDPMPPVEALTPLAEAGLDVAMAVCAPDFMDEIEATTGWVNGRLSSHGISP